LEYLHKAAGLNHGKELPYILRDLSYAYAYNAGFYEESLKYLQEAYKLDGDTSLYFNQKGSIEIQYGYFDEGIKETLKAARIDTTRTDFIWNVAAQYLFSGRYKESLEYFKKYIEKEKSIGELPVTGQNVIGFVFWKNGYKKDAEYWFNEQIRSSEEAIKLGRDYAKLIFLQNNAYYDLAGLYAFRGEKEKAYEYLKIYDNSSSVFPLMLRDDIKKYNPLFNSLRDEPAFQKIANDIDSKYQAEHERVRKWLEEKGMR